MEFHSLLKRALVSPSEECLASLQSRLYDISFIPTSSPPSAKSRQEIFDDEGCYFNLKISTRIGFGE